jgi:Xaa-Pro aminopeptidase
MNAAIAAAEDGMWRMREALEPGMSEVELWSHLWSANIEAGGDWIECRLLASGDRTNPWQQEASSRKIRPNELVCFDTDMIGPFGYCADISRAYFSGPGKPSDEQRELYSRAFEEVHSNLELMKPGASFRELTERSFRQPERFQEQHYPVLAHGVGMSDEWPAIYYPQDEAFIYDGALAPGMTLSVESYVGEVGGREGVKLEQQILITEDGHELLVRFPFEDDLLGWAG